MTLSTFLMPQNHSQPLDVGKLSSRINNIWKKQQKHMTATTQQSTTQTLLTTRNRTKFCGLKQEIQIFNVGVRLFPITYNTCEGGCLSMPSSILCPQCVRTKTETISHILQPGIVTKITSAVQCSCLSEICPRK